jgi:hypothetical protein
LHAGLQEKLMNDLETEVDVTGSRLKATQKKMQVRLGEV